MSPHAYRTPGGPGEGFYSLSGSCSNCGWTGTLSIPRGSKAPGRKFDHSSDAEDCPRCGCRTVTAGFDRRPLW
jgi:rRNA maturation protein Nop10